MKKIILTFFFAIGISVISCNHDKCENIDPYFKINAINSSNLEFTNEGSNPWDVLLEKDTIQWENYFNRVWFESDYFASVPDNNWSLFGNSLYADCPEQGYSGSKIGVENVHIITLFDFDSQFTKNDTIDEIVRLNYWTTSVNDFSEFISIDDYVEQNKTSIKEQYFEFKLASPPDSAFQIAQFRVIYELENGENFETVTEEIVLKK